MRLSGPVTCKLFLFGLGLGLGLGRVAAGTPPAIGEPLLRATVESLGDTPKAYLDGVQLISPRLIAEVYRSRGYALAWTHPGQVESLLQAVEQSPSHGLKPEDFHPATLRALAPPGTLERLGPRERVSADLRLTDALLRYVHHIRFGRLDPVAVNPGQNHRPPIAAETLVAGVEGVLSARDPSARLEALAPRPFFYEQLRQALREHLAAQRLGDLPPIPSGKPLSLGSQDPRVALLRERLGALGEPVGAIPTGTDQFDSALAEAVMAFQRRAGLGADGVVGSATLAALNQPYDEGTASKIRINLERMRWFSDALPPDYILVDVAAFMVHVVRDGTVVWSTRAVVGTAEQQTPSFREEMEHLVFNPTWTVPPSIQKKMRGVSSRYKAVDRQTGRQVSGGNISDYRRYRIVQEAGPTNALGRIKFMFPNGHAIYLHDTPSKGLFSHGSRAYSHGCVRVQNPLKLAEIVLNKASWDQPAISRALDTHKTRYVFLDEHLPVVLNYLTAKVDSEGRLSLRRDIYGRDAALQQAFEGPPSPMRIRFSESAAPSPGSESGSPRQAEAAEPAASESLPLGNPHTGIEPRDSPHFLAENQGDALAAIKRP